MAGADVMRAGKPSVADSVFDLVGGTPLLRLALKGLDCELYLKLERFNPGINVKDRAARNMILEAERRGDLKPGGTIIESSSGNTGLALAMLGAARGYRVIVVVDNHVQKEKIDLIRAFGGEIEHVGRDLPPEEQAGEERETKIRELLDRIPDAFFVNQGDNLDNQAAHYKTTAEEIVEAVGPVDYFFAAIGTGGTISGTGRRLKEYNPDTVVIGVEPEGSVFFGHPYRPFYLTGAGSTKEIWKNIDFSLIDEHFQVGDKEAFNTCRYIARRRGILMGGTGGMVVYKMVEYVATRGVTGKVVGVVPDGGEQYLSTIYDDEWMERHRLHDPAVFEFLDRYIGQPHCAKDPVGGASS